MTNKFHNPFLAPKAPQIENPENGQLSSAAPSSVPLASPVAPQMIQQPIAPGPQSGPQSVPQSGAGTPSAPIIDAATNPFIAPQAPVVPPAPVNPSLVPAPQKAPQSIVRETAATTQAPLKTPNPFDFANQNGGAGSKGGGNANTPAEASSGGERLRYQALAFTGGVGEYYGVVILNFLLTMITFGIYSPWAKVRKQRYFFGHTEFLDEGFHYLATGKQLFVGRIVAILVLVVLSLAEFVPVIGVALSILVLLCGLPFVLNRSVRFNARNLAWRDVRFGWHGSFGMSFLVWMIYPLLSLLTLGLAQPLAARALRRHYAENHSFGGADFSADLGLGSFYVALVKTSLFALVLIGIFGGVSGAIAFASVGDLFKDVSSSDELMIMFAFLTDEQKVLLALPFIGIGFALYLSGHYYFALVRHVMINHLRLAGGIRIRSQLSAFKYAMVIISNLLFNIITIGFAHPYTIVRRYRYLTKSIEVRPIANMAGFIDAQTKAGFSVFEEVSDIEGLSIDI